ncbi:MAG: glycyl-radical enzyme activating protein, partial [bacterium]
MRKFTGTIFDIKKYSIHDGPGIRTTVFFKGCPLRCWWCQNPESQNTKPDIIPAGISKRKFHIQYKKDKELIGMEMTAEEVMAEIRKDIIFYDESGGGVTFSGGEPLFQPDFLHQLLFKCKKEDIHTAVDTCGYASREVVERIIPLTDLFLFDLKLMDDQEHKKYTGVDFQPIKDNLIFLSNQNSVISIRIPVIPGITDTKVNLDKMIQF